MTEEFISGLICVIYLVAFVGYLWYLNWSTKNYNELIRLRNSLQDKEYTTKEIL